jgi:hypothetical protein
MLILDIVWHGEEQKVNPSQKCDKANQCDCRRPMDRGGHGQ